LKAGGGSLYGRKKKAGAMQQDEADDVSDVDLGEDFGDFDPLADEEVGEKSDDESDEEDEAAGEEEAATDDDEASAARGPRRPGRYEEEVEAPAGIRTIVVVPPDERVTSNALTQAEAARAIALRADAIEKGGLAYVEAGELSDAISIARKELYARRTPLTLERQVGRTPAGEAIIEIWAVREMALPALS
jgi:hypothetical protein